jgi:UDP-N-acetylmuramoylalanine-D-glutamate ligase
MPYQLNQKKNIAILGFGREGKSTYEFLTQHQNIKPENITILDNNEAISIPSEACWQTGEDYLT